MYVRACGCAWSENIIGSTLQHYAALLMSVFLSYGS